MNRETMQTRSTHGRFETREENGKKYISGYFAVFGQDYELWPGATESVDPAAFEGALGDDIRCLIDHETRLVLGRTKAGTLTLRTDSHGLWAEAEVNEADTDAMNAWARSQRGDVDQGSFGFDILDEETEIREDGSVHWTIKKVKLYEVSLVTFPAYTDTSVKARKADYEAVRQRQRDEKKARIAKKLEEIKNA